MTRGADPSRPLLVAVPGLGLSCDTVAPTLSALGEVAARCIPLPGYGLPASPSTRLAPPDLAERLLEEIERTHLSQRVVFMGHSSSCQIVTEAAVRCGDRAKGLVLVGPTTDPRAASWAALIVRWLATAMNETPRQIPLLLRDYAHTRLGCMYEAMDASRRHRVERIVTRLRCPLLIVRGPDDRIVPADWIRALATAGRGHAITLPAGAHMLPITHPGALAAVIAPLLVDAGVLDRGVDGVRAGST